MGTSVAASDKWLVFGAPNTDLLPELVSMVATVAADHMTVHQNASVFVAVASSGCMGADATAPLPVLFAPGDHTLPETTMTLRAAGCRLSGVPVRCSSAVRLGVCARLTLSIAAPPPYVQTPGAGVRLLVPAASRSTPLVVDSASVTISQLAVRHLGEAMSEASIYATDGAVGVAPSTGGLLFVSGGASSTFTAARPLVQLTSVELAGASAQRGGLVFVRGAVDMTMDWCALHRGTAAEGGAVFVSDGAKLTSRHTSYWGNVALRDGGAVMAGQGGEVYLTAPASVVGVNVPFTAHTGSVVVANVAG